MRHLKQIEVNVIKNSIVPVGNSFNIYQMYVCLATQRLLFGQIVATNQRGMVFILLIGLNHLTSKNVIQTFISFTYLNDISLYILVPIKVYGDNLTLAKMWKIEFTFIKNN